MKGTNRTSILLAIIVAAANVNILMAAYAHDPGLNHPDDVVVEPLATHSEALHRTDRKFGHRNRSKLPPTDRGRPSAPSAWVSPEETPENT